MEALKLKSGGELSVLSAEAYRGFSVTLGRFHSLQSLLNPAVNLVNFSYRLVGEPTISVPDLTWTASGTEVPKLIAGFTRAYSEHSLFKIKTFANVLCRGYRGYLFQLERQSEL
jgi:hypothetical protein